MSDLPPPFTIPAYASSDHSTRVKLKIPVAAQTAIANQASTSALTLQPPPTSAPRPRLAIPASVHPTAPPAAASSSASLHPSPSVPKSLPSIANGTSTVPLVPPAVGHPLTPAGASVQAGTLSLPQSTYSTGYTQQYTSSTYRPPAPATSLPNSNSVNPTRPYTQPAAAPVPPPALATQRSQSHVSVAKSPTPPETGRPLRYVSVVTKPTGRRLDLDYREGVKVWAVRLSPNETGVRLSGVKFLDDVDEHSDGEERENPEVERHEEEEEEEEDEQDKPVVKRGRGRPKKKPSQESPKGKGKARAKSQVSEDEVQVRLNNVVAVPAEDGVWDIELSGGMNIVEVGVKGGMIWRAYLDRIAAA